MACADTLVERSSSVNAKLLKRRQHIEELNRVQGLLVKLQVRCCCDWLLSIHESCLYCPAGADSMCASPDVWRCAAAESGAAVLYVLQAVFDLPSRMQAALDEDALDSAVSFYAEALPVLRKYGHKGAFRGVAVQADAAAKQVSTALKRRLAERKDETEHVVLLLRQLGEGDDTLQVRRRRDS